jgi:hypothetical protein
MTSNLIDCALDDRDWILQSAGTLPPVGTTATAIQCWTCRRHSCTDSNSSGALSFVVRLPALCLLHNLELVAKQNCRCGSEFSFTSLPFAGSGMLRAGSGRFSDSRATEVRATLKTCRYAQFTDAALSSASRLLIIVQADGGQASAAAGDGWYLRSVLLRSCRAPPHAVSSSRSRRPP